MDPVSKSIVICLCLALVWVGRGFIRVCTHEVLDLLADWTRPPGSLSRSEVTHLFWAPGLRQSNLVLVVDGDIEEYAQLLYTRAELESQIQQDMADVGRVDPHLLNTREDLDRDLGRLRHRIAVTCLGPRLSEVWVESLRVENGELPSLPGSAGPKEDRS